MIFLVGLILIWQSSCKCDLNVKILNKNICFDNLFLIRGSVTLPCYFNLKSPLRMFWFKHVPGHEIKLIVSSFYNRVSFEEEVNKSKLDAETSDKSFNLTLKSIEASDEGSYLCGVNWNSNKICNSCTVQVQQHYLLDPASEGHNVTLNCTVVCGGCAGEHSVYWFRHGTPGSHPGIIYTHGDRSAGCEKNPEAGSSTQSCVYHLPKRNLSTTDAGTYHCAVAACGQITIGNGTKLEISTASRLSSLLLSSRSLQTSLLCFCGEKPCEQVYTLSYFWTICFKCSHTSLKRNRLLVESVMNRPAGFSLFSILYIFFKIKVQTPTCPLQQTSK
uniref:Ig-like domain-containing protein n=1 Tax=Denticeps clupeoides TaxID=299321 RepID=A0AAY4DED2_9TELE